MTNASAARRSRELLQLSSTEPFNAIINTTYSFSQPRQRPAERSTHAGPSHLHPFHKYFKEATDFPAAHILAFKTLLWE